MTFTYTGTLTTNLEKVRLEIGDTIQQDYSLTDAEIVLALTDNTYVLPAAVRAMEWYMARLMGYIAQNAGGVSASYNQKYEQCERQYERLQKRASKGGMYIYAGGIESDRIDSAETDSDFPQPAFRVGMDDFESTNDDPDE
jgi:hypothetical protein